jgi:ABC-type sugar transport system ATPase subunit
MKSILGVERPDAGSVRIDGREVAGWPPHRIARLGVGMVFQHSRPLYRQTVIENIILGLLPDRLLDSFPSPPPRRGRGRSPSVSDWQASSTGAPRRCRSPTCAKWRSPRRSPAIRRWC